MDLGVLSRCLSLYKCLLKLSFTPINHTFYHFISVISFFHTPLFQEGFYPNCNAFIIFLKILLGSCRNNLFILLIYA